MDKEKRLRIRKKIIWTYRCSKGFQLAIVFYTLLGTVKSLLGIAYALLFKQMVDVAMKTAAGSLFGMIFAIAGILLLEEFLSAGQSIAAVQLTHKMENRLKQTMFHETIRSRYQELMKYHSGDLINRIDRDSSTVVGFLTSTIPGTIICAVRLAATFCTMLLLDPLVAVISIVTLPVIIVLVKSFLKKMKQLNKEYREASSQNTAFLQESLQNAFVLKAFEAEDAKEKGMKFLQEKLLRIAVRRNFISVLSGGTLSIGFSAGYILAFLVGAWRMALGKISFGTVSAFLQLVNGVQGPLYSLAGLFPALVSLSVAAERLMELLELEKEEPPEEPIKGSLGIELSHISVGYQDNKGVLQDVSYVFEAGKTTAIIGRTGAGKTTLIRLLLGFLEPENGEIYLCSGGKRVHNCEKTRSNYTYVPQGNTVLSGTLRDNLLQAGERVAEKELGLAVYCACAEFIHDLPEGMNTVIGEKGVGLSEGQALRLAIVRALLKEASIMIFDESTAALDEETQAEVFRRIRAEYRKRTLIFITHKLSMAGYCDNIIKIREKKLYQVRREELQDEIRTAENKVMEMEGLERI